MHMTVPIKTSGRVKTTPCDGACASEGRAAGRAEGQQSVDTCTRCARKGQYSVPKPLAQHRPPRQYEQVGVRAQGRLPRNGNAPQLHERCDLTAPICRQPRSIGGGPQTAFWELEIRSLTCHFFMPRGNAWPLQGRIDIVAF